MKLSLKDRFASKIEKTETCWLWKGALDKNGYGVTWYNKKFEYAHRVSWLFYVKGLTEMPKNVIRHTCDNTQCVNPDHLIEGTHKDNVEDRVRRDRSAKCEQNGRSKLTKENVIFIREAVNNGTHNKSELSRMFSVDRSLIRHIVSRKIWKSI